jgi:hypothetical protein
MNKISAKINVVTVQLLRGLLHKSMLSRNERKRRVEIEGEILYTFVNYIYTNHHDPTRTTAKPAS